MWYARSVGREPRGSSLPVHPILEQRLLDDMEADVDKGQRNLSKQTGMCRRLRSFADRTCNMAHPLVTQAAQTKSTVMLTACVGCMLSSAC